MKTIKSIAEANQVLAAYIPLAKEITGKDITLARMYPLLKLLGNPHKRLKVVHVAGTSGKTSTAYFIAELLRQTGKKVGLTVSPHVDSVTERVQINGKPLEDTKFCDYLNQFLDIIGDSQPTYFELLIAFAFWVFEREKVDYAVVEVGMGGLHDGTNVADAADKVCVITDIGLDHTHVLGNTLSEIATQKAGIIHEHNMVFSYQQNDEIRGVIKETCIKFHAQLCELSLENESLPPQLPLFQQRNWFLAKTVVDYVLQRDSLPELSSQQLKDATTVQIPARMEIVEFEKKTIIMDGAHNPQKMTALVESLRVRFPNQQFTVLIGMLSGKDLEETLKILLPVTKNLTAVTFFAGQDMPRQSIGTEEVLKIAKSQGFKRVKANPSPAEAFRALVRESQDPILVTGSFFLLNHVRPLIFRV